MSVAKFDKIWKIMRHVNLQFEENICKELQCIICSNILINACNGPCGCRYCHKCIIEYLNNGDQFCPGGGTFCRDEVIIIDRNVQIDQAINNRILHMTVKCPQPSCEFRAEVRKIGDHMRLCKLKNASCPYFSIGCKSTNLVEDSLNGHMLAETSFHSILLIEWIENLSNDIGLLKKDISHLRNENSLLKDEVKLLKSEVDNAKTVVQTPEQAQVLRCMERCDKEKETKTEENGCEIDECDMISQSHYDSFRSKANKSHNWHFRHRKRHRGEFVWVVEQFSERMKEQKNDIITSIASSAFYSCHGGYKMCLTIYPNGIQEGANTHLSVGFRILPGHFDAVLQWPFKDDITVSLINQKTGRCHTSKTKKYNDQEIEPNRSLPTFNDQDNVSFPQFIKLYHLLKESPLCYRDRIVIKCVVHASK